MWFQSVFYAVDIGIVVATFFGKQQHSVYVE